MHKGEIDVTNDPVYRAALEKFEQLIPYINADHSALTGDQAVGLVGSEQAAILMGTWAIGAFTKGSNWEPGVDFGAVTFPQQPERILLFHPDAYGRTVNAMAEAKGTTLVLYNLQMAAALIAIAIPLIFFLVLGRILSAV